MPQQMSEAEYVEDHAGNLCPFCRSNNIMGHEMNSDCDYAWRQVECHDCGKLWTEKFTMTGYEESKP